MMRETSVHKRGKVTGDWRKLRNEELLYIYIYIYIYIHTYIHTKTHSNTHNFYVRWEKIH